MMNNSFDKSVFDGIHEDAGRLLAEWEAIPEAKRRTFDLEAFVVKKAEGKFSPQQARAVVDCIRMMDTFWDTARRTVTKETRCLGERDGAEGTASK
jgi:hypothetical protein